MKTFGSYNVSFNGCNHLLNFDFYIGWHVVSNNELIVHCWHDDIDERVEGEFSIKGLDNSFNHEEDYTNLVQFLLTQYTL